MTPNASPLAIYFISASFSTCITFGVRALVAKSTSLISKGTSCNLLIR